MLRHKSGLSFLSLQGVGIIYGLNYVNFLSSMLLESGCAFCYPDPLLCFGEGKNGKWKREGKKGNDIGKRR